MISAADVRSLRYVRGLELRVRARVSVCVTGFRSLSHLTRRSQTPQPPLCVHACRSSTLRSNPSPSPPGQFTSPLSNGQPSSGMPIANPFTSGNGSLSFNRFGAPTLCHSSFQQLGRRLRMDSESPCTDGCASLLSHHLNVVQLPTERRLQSSANSLPHTRSGSADQCLN